mmetsp:Transcript_18013/g.42397  ORF Transcript_18013/g.42397 Transcript_18013/m.42397 type:complete len:302 (+) Transcript_18013:248-1153(+)
MLGATVVPPSPLAAFGQALLRSFTCSGLLDLWRGCAKLGSSPTAPGCSLVPPPAARLTACTTLLLLRFGVWPAHACRLGLPCLCGRGSKLAGLTHGAARTTGRVHSAGVVRTARRKHSWPKWRHARHARHWHHGWHHGRAHHPHTHVEALHSHGLHSHLHANVHAHAEQTSCVRTFLCPMVSATRAADPSTAASSYAFVGLAPSDLGFFPLFGCLSPFLLGFMSSSPSFFTRRLRHFLWRCLQHSIRTSCPCDLCENQLQRLLLLLFLAKDLDLPLDLARPHVLTLLHLDVCTCLFHDIAH